MQLDLTKPREELTVNEARYRASDLMQALRNCLGKRRRVQVARTILANDGNFAERATYQTLFAEEASKSI